jgi:hypothetical protein
MVGNGGIGDMGGKDGDVSDNGCHFRLLRMMHFVVLGLELKVNLKHCRNLRSR